MRVKARCAIFSLSGAILSTCTELATLLDVEMLLSRLGVTIYSESTPDAAMPRRPGHDVASDLGGRYLLRYLRTRDISNATPGSSPLLTGMDRKVWVTPTAYSPREAVRALALPFPKEPRTHVVLLKPENILWLQGPRRIAVGTGIEYLLPDGYPKDSLVLPWEKEVH
jgi:hypothetical protein